MGQNGLLMTQNESLKGLFSIKMLFFIEILKISLIFA